LERAAAGARCGTCGYALGEPPDSYEYVVTWATLPPPPGWTPPPEALANRVVPPELPEPEPEPEPEPLPPCPECGRAMEVVVEWADLPPERGVDE
jgi:hypothetical protein